MRNDNPINIPLTDLDKAIINRYQTGIPLTPTPYQTMAEELNITESQLLHQLQHLLDNGILTRFGPLYNVEKMGGYFTLCAMHVPSTQLEHIVNTINRLDEVAHNYERNHHFNVWFVLALEDKNELEKILQHIQQTTTYPVYNFPKLREFHIGLKLEA